MLNRAFHFTVIHMKHPLPTLISLLLLATALPIAAAAQENPTGSVYMFITYRCAPADRPKLLHAADAVAGTRLAELRRQGVIADHLLLFNAYVDATTWDMLLIVRFDSMAQTERWRAVERDAPGGLTPELLKLATPVNTYFADRKWAKGTMGDQSKAVYLAIPYDYVEKGSYVTYMDAYAIPQFNGWLNEKALNRYEIFLNMYATGTPWDSFILFEYADAAALARRDVVKQKIRSAMLKEPAWKMLQETKQQYRTEREVVTATAIGAGAK